MTTQQLATLIATVGGLGDRLPAAGTTAGSLPAALLWWACAVLVDGSLQLLAVTAVGSLVFSAVAIWACRVEAQRLQHGCRRGRQERGETSSETGNGLQRGVQCGSRPIHVSLCRLPGFQLKKYRRSKSHTHHR